MKRTWTTLSVLLWACGSSQAPQPKTAAAAQEAPPRAAAAAEPSSQALVKEASVSTKSAAKTTASPEPQGCTPQANAEPKVVAGEDQVFDSADRGRTLIFDVAGIALELPACTPEADMHVITVSWETQDRPSASRIHPNFTRHAATLRVDQVLDAAEGAPILVRLQSKRELTKPGEKLVVAVERSDECDAQHKQKLEDGECAHWTLYDTSFDATRNEMVAPIPATGGYRLQFGWVPAK
jgi:hypothetical protein